MRQIAKYMISSAVVLLVSMTSAAAKKDLLADTISVKRAFVDMPVNTLDLLNRSTRLDMLDYFAVDSVYQAPNALEGVSFLKAVDPDFLELQITPVSTLQLKTVKTNKGGDLVVSIYTVSGDNQAPDSDLKFFDSSMQELPRDKFLKLPDLSSFFSIPKGSVTTMKEIKEMVPFPTIVYTAEPGGDDIKAKLTVGAFMDQDDYNIMKLFLKPEITYRWDGKSYKLVK